jgi:signal transduction histidine kinase
VDTQTISVVGFVLAGLAYVLAGLSALSHRELNQPLVRAVAQSAGVGLFVNLALAASTAGYLAWLPAGLRAHLPLYGLVVQAAVFWQLTLRFLRSAQPDRAPIWLALISLATALLLDSDVFVTGDVLLQGRGWVVPRPGFTTALLAVLWGLATGRALWLTRVAYHRTVQPLHRNRQAFWAVALALAVAASGLVWAGWTLLGSVGLVAAFGVAAVSLLRHQLPDARRTIFALFAATIVLALTIAGYAGAVLLSDEVARRVPGLPRWVLAAGLALALVAALNPLLRWMEAGIRRRLSGRVYDPQKLVGEYSLSISNIVELERLATVALGLIADAIGLKQAMLFVVSRVQEAEADPYYRLRAAGSLASDGPTAGTLLGNSPLVEYWRTEFSPLTQYDIDIDPRFAVMSPVERIWLSKLDMDVYVPIYASQDWIGLFALGPKVSRHRYFDDELELLSTLADQTAVALRNARLVDDLVRLNTDLQLAYKDLDEANQRLAQLDRTKSDFINIISHELRTPLAILYGYAQILLEELGKSGEDGNLQLVEGMTTGVNRLNGVIEAMLDMAKIDSRALQIHAAPVHLVHLVQKLAWQLQWTLDERHLRLEVTGLDDLPPIDGDAEALLKAFHHLIINGIKYTPDGGQITIAGRCDPEALPGGAVELIVADTGIGIDPRFLELIFNKFYQAGEVALHSSGRTKFKGGGPGLGLAIARGIVEAHGGTLRAESPGHDETNLPGSRFIVTLPMHQPVQP